jgi:phage/plasmid-associated DNA primase
MPRDDLPMAVEIAAALDATKDVAAPVETPSSETDLLVGSDIEIARRVALDLHKEFGEVVFSDGRFWHYQDTHWRAVDEYELRRAVHAYDGTIYQTPAGQPVAVKLSKSRVTSAIHEMGAMLAQPDFFADASVGINCASGFVAFGPDGTPELQPHDPDHRCRHVLSGGWQPGSAEEPPEGSLLAKLINGVFYGDPDADLKRNLLAETAGSAALGYATKLRRPRAMILEGASAENGKSQILDVIRGALPASAVASIPVSKLGDERFVVHLAAKLLNASDEASSAKSIASDAFKKTITGEPVTGRDVYKSVHTFRPVAQHLLSANALPKFSGMDRGVRRRLRVIVFNRTIPDDERVEHIGLRIAKEEPDLLLAWVVGGAARLIKQREFTNPPSSETALRRWLDTDPVIAWARARADPTDPPQPGKKIIGIKSGYAHSLFKQWALAEGYRDNEIPSVSGFVQRLHAHNPQIEVKHRNSGNWLTGLKILAQDRADDEEDVEEHNPLAGVIDLNAVPR